MSTTYIAARDVCFVSAFLIAGALVGCGEESSGRVGGGDIPEWTLVEELRVGSVGGEDALTSTGQLLIDDSGRMMLAQSSEDRIRIFSPDGEPLSQIGRSGEGPGEFRYITHMGWLADTLWVSDLTARRVSFFSGSGDFLRSVPFSPDLARPFFPSAPVAMALDGTVLMSPAWGGGAIDRGEITGPPVLHLSRDGEVLDTVAWIPINVTRVSLESPSRELPISVTPPFLPRVRWSASPFGDHIVLVDQHVSSPGSSEDTYTLHKIASSADTAWSIPVPYPPLTISSAAVDHAVRSIAAGYMRGERAGLFPSEEAAFETIKDVVEIPDYFPPVTDVVVTSDGRIWVRREPVASDEIRWDVFSESGDFSGHLRLPADSRIREAKDDLLWTTETDDLEVPYIVRYRIER